MIFFCVLEAPHHCRSDPDKTVTHFMPTELKMPVNKIFYQIHHLGAIRPSDTNYCPFENFKHNELVITRDGQMILKLLGLFNSREVSVSSHCIRARI